jgi:hypothetical protein
MWMKHIITVYEMQPPSEIQENSTIHMSDITEN